MIARWKAFLLEHQAEWRLPNGGDWNYVFHNNYHPHHSNINVLWFHGDEKSPCVVAKIYQSSETPKREFANLQRAHAHAPVSVPKPLYCGFHDGYWMLWMRGVPGSRPRGIDARMLSEVVSIVAEIHRALRNGATGASDERHARVVERPLAAITEFGSAPSVIAGCARLASEASSSWLASLPLIPQHGDLYVDNLLSDGARWYVIDWEIFGEIDLPAYDVFTLLYSALRRGAGTGDTWDPSLVRHLPAIMNHYMKELDLPAGSLRLLFPLALVNWFHVQWRDGRREFADHMYSAIQHYFENRARWEAAFLGSVGTS